MGGIKPEVPGAGGSATAEVEGAAWVEQATVNKRSRAMEAASHPVHPNTVSPLETLSAGPGCAQQLLVWSVTD